MPCGVCRFVRHFFGCYLNLAIDRVHDVQDRDSVMRAARREGRLGLPPKFPVARRLIEDVLAPITF